MPTIRAHGEFVCFSLHPCLIGPPQENCQFLILKYKEMKNITILQICDVLGLKI
jgi:hypothetical protein